MLGGVVPLARLVLLVGTIAAVSLSILANLLSRKLPDAVPAVLIPITLMALLGLFQLRPATESLAAQMDHAVHKVELPTDIPDLAHTLIPADTRSTIATLLGLALLSCVAFDQLRSPRAVAVASVLTIVNGLAIASVGMTHMYKDQYFFLNENWVLGGSRSLNAAFATFVNGNNAAGWLCLCVAVAAGWISWHLTPGPTSRKLQHGRLRVSTFGRAWQRSIEFLAGLTVWQIITLTAIALLAAAVAATRSRGGMLALAAGIVLAAVCRSSVRRLPVALLLLAGFGIATFGVLRWLELDAGVVSEMKTLENFDEAVGSRPEHWQDSLTAVRDFPFFGTGLGSYRLATLAYSTHFSTVWYRNADNHYIDVLVEGGLIGLTLFGGIGLIGLVTGFAAWRQGKTKTVSRNSDAPRLSRRVLSGLGTAVVVATATQAIAAVVDFGVGLPAASSMMVMIIAVAAGFLNGGAVAASLKQSGCFRVGIIIVTPVQLLLAGGAAILIPDQIAATQIDELVVAGHRILDAPVEASQLDRLGDVRAKLKSAIDARRDDAEGLSMQVRLAEADFRLKILRLSRGDALQDNPQFARLWNNVSLQVLIMQLAEIEQQQPATAARLRKQILDTMSASELQSALATASHHFPNMPRIAETQAAIAVLINDADTFNERASFARFADPSNAGTLFRLGSLALFIDQPGVAESAWQESLALSHRFRSLILIDALREWTSEEAMDLFGPRDYIACVESARRCPSVELKQELWRRSEEFWNKVQSPVDIETANVRVQHLLAQNRRKEALDWLKPIVKSYNDDNRLRKQFAQLLEWDGQFRNAMQEWHGILYLNPGDADAEAAMTRMRNLKSSKEQGSEER